VYLPRPEHCKVIKTKIKGFETTIVSLKYMQHLRAGRVPKFQKVYPVSLIIIGNVIVQSGKVDPYISSEFEFFSCSTSINFLGAKI
jgi:hypothetical protein